MALVAVRPAKPTGVVRRRDQHPLAMSMAAVESAVTSLSIEILDASNSAWPPTPWIGCDQALSDPAFFSWWQKRVARRLAKQYAPAPGKAHVPDRTTAGYVLRCYPIIPGYLVRCSFTPRGGYRGWRRNGLPSGLTPQPLKASRCDKAGSGVYTTIPKPGITMRCRCPMRQHSAPYCASR